MGSERCFQNATRLVTLEGSLLLLIGSLFISLREWSVEWNRLTVVKYWSKTLWINLVNNAFKLGVQQPNLPTVPTLAILQVVGMHISYSGGVCIIENVRYFWRHKRGIHHSKRNNCNSRVQKTSLSGWRATHHRWCKQEIIRQHGPSSPKRWISYHDYDVTVWVLGSTVSHIAFKDYN